MSEKKEEFLAEIESEIKRRRFFQNFYKILRVALMVTIAVSGFATAAVSQIELNNSANWIFYFGLISAVCAVLNQSLNPSESNLFNQSARKALQYVMGEVKYGKMEVGEAHRYKSLAMTNPEIVLGDLENMFNGSEKADG